MAIGRSKAKFPGRPCRDAPPRWVSIDPASGKKPTVAVVWEGTEAVEYVAVRHESRDALQMLIIGCDVVVLEGGGYVGDNAAAALGLERVRERIETIAYYEGASAVPVSPDQWRMVLRLPARPRRRAVDAARQLCMILGRPGTCPGSPLAAQATNDDKRAAFLIGWAALDAWGW
jgi:hypothetical protein